MSTVVWRILALMCAAVALFLTIGDMASAPLSGDDGVLLRSIDGRSYTRFVVERVDPATGDTGGMRVGDIVTPTDSSFAGRLHASRALAGQTTTYVVERGTHRFTTSITLRPIRQNVVVLTEIYDVVRLAMIGIAVLIAVRRPGSSDARALVTFLLSLGATLAASGSWLPDTAYLLFGITRIPVQIFGLAQATHFASIFPFRSERGLRAWIRRFTPWYSIAVGGAVYAYTLVLFTTAQSSPYPALNAVARWGVLYYFAAITVAFWIASASASGEDKQRVNWVGLSMAFGFAGPLLQIVLVYGFHFTGDWLNFLALTIIAVPIGLAYTILRHRTIDVGFVVSRALVLTLLSFLVIGAFGLLERALGKFFIEASHLTSRSLEIALALGLGFSLRSLHARIERAIDRIFFRKRHAAIASLRRFARDVEHITDPDVVIERTVETVARDADAQNVALYLIADRVFGCAVAAGGAAFPPEVDENDPLFVHLRAQRGPAKLRGLASAIDGDTAFPMFVRATLVGALVLRAKTSGETYDPEETGLIEDLAQRACITLDALQTIAMRRELAALIDAHQAPVRRHDALGMANGTSATSGVDTPV